MNICHKCGKKYSGNIILDGNNNIWCKECANKQLKVMVNKASSRDKEFYIRVIKGKTAKKEKHDQPR